MATRIRDLIHILRQKPAPHEEQCEFEETSKEELWASRKQSKNIIYVLSYACGCAICAGRCNFYTSFPRLFLQFLATIGCGVGFGFIIGAIVVTIFGLQEPPLSPAIKLLTLILVPALIMGLVSQI